MPDYLKYGLLRHRNPLQLYVRIKPYEVNLAAEQHECGAARHDTTTWIEEASKASWPDVCRTLTYMDVVV